MHGRQKIERTPDEETAKIKDRMRKVKAYQTAMKLIFEKRTMGKLDAGLLDLTAQVLNANPDISTVWNIRREVLLYLKNSEPGTFQDCVPKELALIEVCLRSNPKSYGAWHHRYWLMKETNFEKVSEEIKLCSKYLSLDERNFHCWDYRRYLLENSKSISQEQELEFTTEKIVSNFSNYSSWHLRSTLLPQLSEDFLSNELQLVKNAAFTDPNDQSVWLYHRWLLLSRVSKHSDKIKILEGELEWVQELNDLETNNKWITSTLILLMRLTDVKKFSSKIEDCVTKLIQLDPYRQNYYIDIREKYKLDSSTQQRDLH